MRYVSNAWVRLKSIKSKMTYVLAGFGLIVGSGGLVLTTMLGTAHAAPATTITNVQKQGWFFLDDNGHGGSGKFVAGPDTPPSGTGSVELDVTASNQGYLFGKAAWGGTKLSDIKKLGYSTYVTTGNNTTAPALQIDVDSNVNDNDNSYQGRLVYEPYLTHQVTDGTWQSWNPLDNSTSDGTHGNWWFSNGTVASTTGCAQGTPCTWKTVLQELSHGGVSSAYPLVGFKAGSGWSPFQGNVDAFTIGVGNKTTEYNFDYQGCTSVNTTKGALTAALVGGNVSGDVDATGCDIGVYYNHGDSGQVTNAQIHDANQYGVFVDGVSGNANVDVNKSHVYAIGNHSSGVYAPNGGQTGVGVYYDTLSDSNIVTAGKVTGSVSNNTIEKYQKNGVAINGTRSDVDVSDNIVVGAGPVDYIAQNGIEFARGGTGSATGNTVSGNAYTGSNDATSAGVLIYGGNGTPLVTNVSVGNNKLIDNDVAINFADYSSDGNGAATSATKNVANNNWIFSSHVTNTTGLPSGTSAVGYQAGIEDVGDKDSACGNTILGPGYADQGSYDTTSMTAVPGPDNAVVRDIDAGYTFPTTSFSVCHSSSNYGGGNFGPGYFRFYGQRFNHHWWF